MATHQELEAVVTGLFKELWDVSQGKTIPDQSNLRLGSNHGITLDATVLYADMKDSTGLVDAFPNWFAAEIYKSYLHCAASIIKSCGGSVTAYDGDRVMGVFLGGSKNSYAVKAAFKINHSLQQIINPSLLRLYPRSNYVAGHTIGVDTSELLAARTGVRNHNDLVWVGRAANHAAKLCAETGGGSLRITPDVYSALHDTIKSYLGSSMWTYQAYAVACGGPIWTSDWYFQQGYDPC